MTTETHQQTIGELLTSIRKIKKRNIKPAHENPSLTNFDQLPDAAFVNSQTVKVLFGISTATLWRHVKLGKIPAPHDARWNVGELRQALASKKGAQS